MQTNFEVVGRGPAPSQPLGADVLPGILTANPRDTVK